MSETSVSGTVFWESRLKSVENLVFTQKLLCLVMNNPSNNFDKIGNSEMGQYFLRSVLEPFLKSGLTFAILQLLGNKLSLTERL